MSQISLYRGLVEIIPLCCSLWGHLILKRDRKETNRTQTSLLQQLVTAHALNIWHHWDAIAGSDVQSWLFVCERDIQRDKNSVWCVFSVRREREATQAQMEQKNTPECLFALFECAARSLFFGRRYIPTEIQPGEPSVQQQAWKWWSDSSPDIDAQIVLVMVRKWMVVYCSSIKYTRSGFTRFDSEIWVSIQQQQRPL